MGKAAPSSAPPATTTATTTTVAMDTKLKKKKGRPPKNTPPNRRSTRRNPNDFNSPPPFDDDEDERKQKKVKLVVRLPESENHNPKSNARRKHQSRDSDSGSASGSGSDPESEDRSAFAKKRKINGGSDDAASPQEKEEEEEEEEMKGTESPAPGSQLEPGPTTPLPEKTLLIFILDRLQKKDTYGVFSEAVDPDELPDYFEIIEQPMDFGTVRKKLDSGAYKNLEQLEADIFLICANAMQYNAPDTIYYRQARSIQELAKRDFQNLKNEGEDGEPQPKVVRRGRPPGIKMQKKSQETSSPNDSSVPNVVPELSSGATLANEDEKAGSTSYNLRKAPMQSRFRSSDPFASAYMSRNGENHYDWSANWHNEFPAHILRADLKYGNKHFTVDENRRHTYKQVSQSSSGTSNNPVSSNFIGVKRLVMVGLQEPLAYARSLARYAATLGPVAWKIAANKIQAGIPPGTQFGPGWVGDNGLPSRPPTFSNEKQKSAINTPSLRTPSTSDPSPPVSNGPSQGMFEAAHKLNSQNEQKPVIHPHPSSSAGIQSPTEQKPVFQPHANNSGGMQSPTEQKPVFQPHANSSAGMAVMQQQHKYSLSDPPDLNVRVLVGSPPSSSSLQQIGSPQQPDLALQL